MIGKYNSYMAPSISSSCLFPFIQDHLEQVGRFRQIDLLSESNFVKFAKERGIELSGVVNNTDAWFLVRQGMLTVDEIYESLTWDERRKGRLPAHYDFPKTGQAYIFDEGARLPELSFHPFRIYTCHMLMLPRFGLGTISHLYHDNGERIPEFRRSQAQQLALSPEFSNWLDYYNGVADLCILLEPIFWSSVTGIVRGELSRSIEDDDGNYLAGDLLDLFDTNENWKSYKLDVFALLNQIGVEELRKAHENLRLDATTLDENGELYLLIRTSNWYKRKDLKGGIGGALWIRHMAELIRLAVKDVFSVDLEAEDVDFGYWFPGARERLYGADNPLADTGRLQRALLPAWSMEASIRVRVYAEGQTEEGFLEYMYGNSFGYLIEMVPVRGTKWDEIASHLKNDLLARRLSLILMDGDQVNALKSVKTHVENGLVVGAVHISEPDFEFGNFSDETLLVAAEDVLCMAIADEIREGAFRNRSGKSFTAFLAKELVCQEIKGTNFGEALAKAFCSDAAYKDSTLDRVLNLLNHSETTHYDEERLKVQVGEIDKVINRLNLEKRLPSSRKQP